MTKPAKKTAAPAKAVAPAATVSSGVSTVVTDLEAGAQVLVGILGAGKLSIVDDIARAAVKAAVTQLENGVDHLQAVTDAGIAASPVFAQALPVAKSILTQLGIVLPPEQQIVDSIKAAIVDLGHAITPPAPAVAV